MATKLVSITKSTRKNKKLMATFSINGRSKTTHFGGKGCGDYTVYSKQSHALADTKRKNYIKRHRVNESWRDPTTAATLSRYILWEKRTIPAAIRAYKKRFGV
jgi:hypothetical protein